MSRLIDVDKAENDIVENVTTKAVSRVVAILQGQPTVKAIPIEWIKKWLETCIPHYDYDRMTYIADVYEMLEDWEKENERETD